MKSYDIYELIAADNVAELLDEDELAKIGSEAKEGYERDEESRQSWIDQTEEWMKLATQVLEQKNFPWPGCYTLDTEVLTSEGWKPVAEIKKGEFVYSRAPGGGSGYYPVTETFFGETKDLIHFKGKSIDLLVTPNHNMVLENKKGEMFTRPANDIKTGHYIPLTSKWSGSSEEYYYGVPTKAYLRFLGWYISEGYAQYSGNSYTAVNGEFRDYGLSPGSFGIAQCKKVNPDKYKIIQQDLDDCGFSYNAHDRGFNIHARSLPEEIKEQLRSLGKVYDKHIPREVLKFSPELLEGMLDTLILGDGTTSTKNGHREYYTCSKRLADDVQELCQKVGLRGTIKNLGIKNGNIKGREIKGTCDLYSVSINRKSRVQTSKLSVEHIKLESSQKIACVTVEPYHSLYVRRNGISVWCGNSASVKYPLITIAAIQFHARAYPALLPKTKLVKTQVVGKDEDGSKAARANRISKHMTWQLMKKMKSWEREMDKSLLILPIIGCIFKKTYYDPIRQVNQSDMIMPRHIVVDYWAKDLDSAQRITQVIEMTDNEIHSYQKAGLFLDVDLQRDLPFEQEKSNGNQVAPQGEIYAPKVLLEQHTWIDLDGDGYLEPYIVTLQKSSGKVLRIKARYDEDSVFINDKEEVIYIDPIKYFTKYTFIPNPDGGFYDLGFGTLLGPVNKSCNSIVNQLLDAGTLSNTQGGFLGRGLRIKEGTVRFRPNEWKVVNASGNDIAKSVFPLPVREPSQVSYNLLVFLLQAGEKLSSTVDVMMGELPGQNTPATNMMAAIEQGSKVFTAVYKRIYKSLEEEFQKIFRLNGIYLNEQEYFTVLDEDQTTTEQIGVGDYSLDDFDIIPAADPTVAADSLKYAKAQALMELIPLGTINVGEATKRILEAQEQDNIPGIMQEPPPPPPDPKIELEKMKLQMEAQFKQMEFDLKQQQLELERLELLSQLDKNEAEIGLSKAKAHSERAKGASQLHEILNTLNPEKEVEGELNGTNSIRSM